MKKLVSMLVVLIVLAVFTAGTAMAQAKPLEWKMISTWTPAINLIEADRYFVKMVNQMSGGRFKIDLHPAPELVPPNQVFDAISKGSFPIGGEWPNYWAGKTRCLTSLVPTPWGFASMTM